MASTYLQRTQSAGNRKTYTFSAWVKRSNLSSQQNIFGTPAEGEAFGFNSGSQLYFYHNGSSGSYIVSNALFRDTSAWYHLVVMNDTSQATASNRVKIYVNGEQITSFSSSTYPAQDSEFKVNQSGQTIYVGQGHAGNIFDGSMAHVHFIDGTAYDASAFGQTDATTGIWTPKLSPSVTYGTNGFFLKFASSGSMGTDSSGNGNNFTVGAGNLTQTQDTPSNVFATLNPLFTGNGAQLTQGNTKVTLQNGTAGWTSCASTIALPSAGKYYAEFKVANYVNGYMGLGFYLDGATQLQGNTSSTGANNVNWWSQYGHDTNFHNLGGTVSGAQTWSSGILMLAHDSDTGKVWWGHNGTWFNSGNPATGTNAPFTITRNGRNLYMIVEGYNGVIWESNFGNGYFGTTAVSSANSDGDGYGLFEYEVPSGYYALCTKNINTYG